MDPHVKGLWSVFWRMILFVPVGILGCAALLLVIGLSVLPPMYAIGAFFNGGYLSGLIALGVWILWLRYGGPIRRLVFEGFEHGSL
jgi:hypothetical protein